MKTLNKSGVALVLVGSLIVFNSDFSRASSWACGGCTNGTNGGNNGNNGNDGNSGNKNKNHQLHVPGVVTSAASPGLNTVFSCTNLDPVKPVSVDILLNDASGASLTVGIPSPNPLSNIGPDQTVTAVTNNASYFPSSNTVVLTVDSTLSPGSATIRSTKAKISCAAYLIDGSTPPKPLIPLPVVSGKQKGK